MRAASRLTLRLLAVTAALLVAAGGALAAPAAPDTLVLVNGDPITTKEFDRLIMEAHREFDSPEQGVGLAGRLLDRRIRDYLILQDAMAAGYDTEAPFVAMVEEKEREFAIQAYVKENLDRPVAAPADSVRAFFDRFYWRIQVRRLSVLDGALAGDLRGRVLDGGDMDALAREHSVDTKKLTGGLTKLLYWADVENRIRDQVRGLAAGELSGVFPYNDAFAFVRVEQVLPVHDEAFADFEAEIASDTLGRLRQQTWDDFVDDHIGRVEIQENMAALAEVIADSAVVLKGEFRVEQPAIVIGHKVGEKDGFGVTGTELRKDISHEALQGAQTAFTTHLARARRQAKTRIALAVAARSAGFFADDGVAERVNKEWEKALIEAYLNDTVVPRITFRRDEFDAFYQENLEAFRGPEEVRLDIMILDEKEQAEEAAERLRGGADFGYIFRQYQPDQEINLGQSNFIKATELSQAFRDELVHMEPGQSSGAVVMPMGFMVFKLDARRPGSVPPLESVEMDIRRVLYRRKFNQLLDEQIARLTEQAEIKRWPGRIEAFLQPVGEGKP